MTLGRRCLLHDLLVHDLESLHRLQVLGLGLEGLGQPQEGRGARQAGVVGVHQVGVLQEPPLPLTLTLTLVLDAVAPALHRGVGQDGGGRGGRGGEVGHADDDALGGGVHRGAGGSFLKVVGSDLHGQVAAVLARVGHVPGVPALGGRQVGAGEAVPVGVVLGAGGHVSEGHVTTLSLTLTFGNAAGPAPAAALRTPVPGEGVGGEGLGGGRAGHLQVLALILLSQFLLLLLLLARVVAARAAHDAEPQRHAGQQHSADGAQDDHVQGQLGVVLVIWQQAD